MVRRLMTAGWLAAGLCPLLAGCTVDQYAHMVLEQDTSWGRIAEKMAGTSEQLVKAGKISWARRLTMPDDVQIDVWGLGAAAGEDAPGTVLVLHGLTDSKVSYLPMARMLAEKGFDVVLPDLRAHGRSTGKYVTFGALESRDLRHVMDSLLAENAVREPLYVFGASMNLGGSTAIIYASRDPRVRGVVAVAPSRSFRATVGRFQYTKLLDAAKLDRIAERAGNLGGFTPDEASALRAIAKVHCPVLLIHGKLDMFTPVADSEALYDAAHQPKELQVISWAGHLGMVIGQEAKMVKEIERVAAGKLISTTMPAKEVTAPPEEEP